MNTKKKQDTFSYRWWLISDSFIKRSFASLGYQLMGALLFYLVLILVFLFLGAFFFLGSKIVDLF